MTTTMPTRSSTAPSTSDPRWRSLARVAGVAYLLMFALAIVGNLLFLEPVLADDPATTAANIASSPELVRAGGAAFLVIVVLDVLLAWALPLIFGSVAPEVARLMGWFRLAYSAMLGVAVAFLALAASPAVPGADAGVLAAAFTTTWMLGLAVFGVHLILLGWLVWQAPFAPRVMGALLALAGVAYVADTLTRLLGSGSLLVDGPLTPVVAVLSIVSEGWLAVWLLVARRPAS